MENLHFANRNQLLHLASLAQVSDMVALGEFFHAQEDTIAHTKKIGGRDLSKYYGGENGGSLGHAIHAHNPDQTWRDTDKAMMMAKQVYEDLKAIHADKQQLYPLSSGRDPSVDDVTPDPDWDALVKKGDLMTFMAFPPHVVREHLWYDEQVTVYGYNEKIQTLKMPYVWDARYNSIFPTEKGFVSGHYWSTKAQAAISAIGSVGASMGDFGFGF
jgi:hypothetical protein